MIGTTVRILVGLMVGAAMLIAVAIALCADLFAPETRPSLRGARVPLVRMLRPPTQPNRARRSLMEAST
jgi:hypothetical protein